MLLLLVIPELRLGPDSSALGLSDHLQKIDCMHAFTSICYLEVCQVALVHLCCSEREMKRCASDMSEDDSTGNVVLPDGGGKKAVSLPSTVATTERELQFNASFPELPDPSRPATRGVCCGTLD